MAIYVYKSDTGALASWCPNDTDQVADAVTLQENGLSAVIGLPALSSTIGWDEVNRTTKSVTPSAKPQPILTGIWILRFTAAEFQAIAASTDATVQQFMYALNHTTQVDLSTTQMVNGANYLLSIGLIEAARLAVIMAAPSSINGP